jgi:hypothetical protein
MDKFPITRRQLDTCWVKVLCAHFLKWDPVAADINIDEDAHVEWKYRMLGEAIDMVRSDGLK